MENIIRIVMLCVVALMTCSCSFAPLSPRVDAASIGKNEVKLESNFTPSPSLGILYGVTEDIDIGVEFEQFALGSVWARYSIINNPTGFSFAGNAGVFGSTANNRRSNGWYAGLLVSNQVSSTVRLSAGYRHALLDYEYSLEDDYDWFNNLEFNNPDDASVNGQLELTLSILLKPHVELALGGVCQYLFKNKDPDNEDQLCIPTIGFSFYRL